MEYLPTLTPKVIKNNPNVGKYSIHGSLGYDLIFFFELTMVSSDQFLLTVAFPKLIR